MVDTTETAIYKLGYDVGDDSRKVDALRESVQKLVDTTEKSVASEEKVTAARRTTEAGLDRLLGKLDPNIRKQQELQKVQEQLARFADEGVGSEQKRAAALDLANKKYGEGTEAASGFGKILQWLGGQHKAAGADADDHGRRTNAIKDAMNLLKPAAEAAGTSIANLGPFAAAARLGMVGLGAAITGSVIIALIDAADKARVLRSTLDALTGNREGGAAAFGGLKQSAESAGVSVNTLKGAYQELLLVQDEQNRKRGVVFAPGAETAVKQINSLTEALALAGKAGLLTEQQIAQGSNIIAQSLAQNGILTGDSFMQLMRTVPELGRAIMAAMGEGSGSVSRFRDRLNEGDVSLGKLSDGFDRLIPKLREVNKETPATLAQGWDSLKTQIEDTTAALSKGLGVEGLTRNFTSGLRLLTNDTGTFFSELADMVGAGAMKIVEAEITIFSKGPAVLAGELAKASSMIATWVANSLAQIAQVGMAAVSRAGGGPVSGGVSGGYDFTLPPDLQYGGGSGGGGFVTAPYTGDYGGEFSGGFASGLDSIIPPGYPNDSYPVRMNVESGERLIVVPRNQTLSDFVGGRNPINLGRLAGGINLDVGPGGSTMAGPNIDAAITQQGSRLLDLGASYQDLLGKLGVTFDDWRQTISGAGNDDIPDVIRQGNIQIITSESMSSTKIINAINQSSAAQVGAMNALAAHVSSSAASISAAGSASFGVAAGSSYGSAPIPGVYNIGRVSSGGGAMGGAKNTDDWGFSSRGDYGQMPPVAAQRAPGSSLSTWASPTTSSGGPGYFGALPPTQGYDTGGFNADDFYGGEFYGAYAAGGRFMIGGDGGVDTTPVRFNGTRGEIVTISPPGRSSSPGGQPGRVTNIYQTVQVSYHVDMTQAGLSPAQIADQTRIATQRAIASA